MKNILIQADNLMALNFLLKERNLKGKIDLIYIMDLKRVMVQF
jgi:adenine-specific DNA-methyltransferase